MNNISAGSAPICVDTDFDCSDEESERNGMTLEPSFSLWGQWFAAVLHVLPSSILLVDVDYFLPADRFLFCDGEPFVAVFIAKWEVGHDCHLRGQYAHISHRYNLSCVI